jgi:protein-tyrosine-phosphatase
LRVLFKCKGNICRSPAAMYYLQKRRPLWTVHSVATTAGCRGQTIHPYMATALEAEFIPCSRRREVCIGDEYPLNDTDYDKVYDLHAEGIQDPYLTGNFKEALDEIIEFVDSKFFL